MTIYRCDHIHLKASDVEATARWYCKILGAKLLFEGQLSGSKVFYISIHGTTFIIFGLLEGETAPIEPSPHCKYGMDHFCFQVDNVDQAVSELRAKKVKIIKEPTTIRPGLRIACIEGPDKVRIELSQKSWE